MTAVLALALSAPALCQSPVAGAQRPARLVGQVIDPASGAGISGARVDLAGEQRSVTTDADGRFVIEPIASGLHTLIATLEGFAPSPPILIEVAPAGDTTVAILYKLSIIAEVQARATRPEPLLLPGAAATVLESRQILTQPGGLEDVYRVLQMSPGVAASQDNRNDLLVRGAGPIETGTLIDGFVVPNASHFGAQGGTSGGISLVAPTLIEQAAIEAGGFSVAHGERASSIVTLSLRPGNAQRLAGAVGAGVGGGMATVEGPWPGQRGTWLAAARRSFLELVIDEESETVRPKYADGVVRADLHLSGRHRLGMLGLAGWDSVVSRSKRDNFETLRGTIEIAVAGARLTSQWTESTSSRVSASLATTRIDFISRDRTKIDLSDQSRETELRVQADVRHTLGVAGEATAGMEVKRAFLKFDLDAAAFRNEYGNLVPALLARRRETLTDAAGYVELVSRIGSRLRTRAGVRVDRSGSTRKFYASPRIKAEYSLWTGLRLTGAWGVFRQSIPYIWIGSHPGNASLDPVRSTQVLAGADWQIGTHVRVAVEGFDKRYDGYPVDPAEPPRVMISAASDFESPFVGALVSAGRVRARGVDTAATAVLLRGLEAGVGYSWWRVRQQGLDAVWRCAEFDITHQARVNLAFSRGNWSAGSSWRYATGRPFTPFDVIASTKANAGRYDRTRVNAERFPPYHRFDLRVERAFALRRFRLVAYGELDNVYGRDNVYLYEWDKTFKRAKPVFQWGRTAVGGVRLEF